MNGKTFIAIALAGLFAGASSAWAGGGYKHGALPKHSVQTPVSVADATPDQAYSSPASRGGTWSIDASSSASSSIGHDSSLSMSSSTSEQFGTGASGSEGASGSVGMDFSLSSDSGSTE